LLHYASGNDRNKKIAYAEWVQTIQQHFSDDLQFQWLLIQFKMLPTILKSNESELTVQDITSALLALEDAQQIFLKLTNSTNCCACY